MTMLRYPHQVQSSGIVSCDCAAKLWDKNRFIHSHRINESTGFDSPTRRSVRGKRNASPNKARGLCRSILLSILLNKPPHYSQYTWYDMSTVVPYIYGLSPRFAPPRPARRRQTTFTGHSTAREEKNVMLWIAADTWVTVLLVKPSRRIHTPSCSLERYIAFADKLPFRPLGRFTSSDRQIDLEFLTLSQQSLLRQQDRYSGARLFSGQQDASQHIP
jgi:hypothetical protein